MTYCLMSVAPLPHKQRPSPRPDQSATKRRRKPFAVHRLRWIGLAAVSISLLGVAAGGAGLWQLNSQSPAYRPFVATEWKRGANLSPGALPAEHPRRHMAYAVQDWLEAEHPARFQVQNRLGLPDLRPQPDTEIYRVGCGFTGPGCQNEDWLVVQYGVDGRVEGTAFERASAAP